jgi:predicted anti-sigma-YlaC factor YlaD
MTAVYDRRPMARTRSFLATAGVLLPAMTFSACSIERIATNRLADTLADSGTTYAADDDPELVEAALPFSLKLMEGVLVETPEHRPLLAATAAGFTQYAWAFVQQEGDALALKDTDRAWESWTRARKLYLRARDYGLRGLEVAHPGFGAALAADAVGAAARAGREEVELLYWTAVSWAAAVALGKDDPALVADLPKVSALIDRALAVDEAWDRGAIHAFMVTYSMARPDQPENRDAAAKRHFDRAIELTRGRAAAPYVSWAEAVCLPREDRACLEQAVTAALAIDADAEPDIRLANTAMQRRAAWLKANVDRWILPPLDDAADQGPQS